MLSRDCPYYLFLLIKNNTLALIDEYCGHCELYSGFGFILSNWRDNHCAKTMRNLNGDNIQKKSTVVQVEVVPLETHRFFP